MISHIDTKEPLEAKLTFSLKKDPNYRSLEKDANETDATNQSNLFVEIENGDGFLDSGRSKERYLTNTMSLIHLFKVFTGPSTVGMPRLIANGGLLVGPVVFIIMGYLNNVCNITLVSCAQILCKRLKHSSMTYEEIMEQSILSNNRRTVHKFAPFIRGMTKVFLFIAQFGLVSFYIQAIGTTVQEHVGRYTYYPIPLLVTEVLVCVLLIPYTWMRNLKILSWFSCTATILTLICVVTVILYSWQSLQPVSHLPLITHDPWEIPILIGGSIFAVEGVAMVIPLENKTKRSQDFGGAFGLVTIATTCNIVVNLAVGFYGYMAIGEHVTGNILIFLPHQWIYGVVSLAYAAALFFTYTLQLYLPAELLATVLRDNIKAAFIQNNAAWIARTLLVIASYILATVIPKMELLMSLFGSFAMVMLLFIFPPVAELLIYQQDPTGLSRYTILKDIFLLTCGILTLVIGTYTSLWEILVALNEKFDP